MRYLNFDLDERIYKDRRKQEPSLIKEGCYRGIDYFITTMCQHPCAYIVEPNGMSIHKAEMRVNGGVTYDEMGHWLVRKSQSRIIGWDYAHCWDVMYLPHEDFYQPEDMARTHTVESVESDIHKAIDGILDGYKEEK